MVGLIAAYLPPRARVLAAEGDFTSLLFPLFAAGCDARTSRWSGRPTRSTAAPTWWPSPPSNPQTDGSPIWSHLRRSSHDRAPREEDRDDRDECKR